MELNDSVIEGLVKVACDLPGTVGNELLKIAKEIAAYKMQFKRRRREKNPRKRMKTRSWRIRHKPQTKRRNKIWRKRNKMQLKRRRNYRHMKPIGYTPGVKK